MVCDVCTCAEGKRSVVVMSARVQRERGVWFAMCARVQREGKDECGCAMCAHVLSMQRGVLCCEHTFMCGGVGGESLMWYRGEEPGGGYQPIMILL